MSIIYGRPASGSASIGGEMSRVFSASNDLVCLSVRISRSGSAYFRNIKFNGRAMSEYFCTKRRYTFAAPKKDRNLRDGPENTAFANALELSTATESLPGVSTCPR